MFANEPIPANWEVVPEGAIWWMTIVGGLAGGLAFALFAFVLDFLLEKWADWKEEESEADVTAEDPETVTPWTPTIDPHWIAKDIQQYLFMREIIEDARDYIARS